MTSDAAHHLSAAPREGLELSRLRRFLDGSQDIFDVLESRRQDGVKKNNHSAEYLVSMLKQAFSAMKSAERRIRDMDERIRQLETLADTDELTGLANRRGFFRAFGKELSFVERGLHDGGLLMLIDLDNFKTINDTYGHMAGDACLRLVGRFLQGEVRGMDAAARLGGDEFVLLLPGTKKGPVLARAQDLAVRLSRLSLLWEDRDIRISASLGLKTYARGDDPARILGAADESLYAFKHERKMNGMKQQP